MKKFLIAALIGCTCPLFAQPSSVTVSETQVQDTKHVVEREKDGKKWQLTLKNYEIEHFTVNGKEIPAKDYPQYQNIIDGLRAVASGYEMPSDVVVTPKGISNATATRTTTKQAITTESGQLTPEQKYVNQKIEEALRNDNLLPANNEQDFQLELTEKTMLINGKEMSKEVVEKYVAIYRNNSPSKSCATCTFQLAFKRLAQRSSGW